MTFQPDKPESSDILSDSQADLQENFSVVNSVFGNDHYPFDDAIAGNRGKHKHVTILETTDVDENGDLILPQTGDQDVVVYSKEVDSGYNNLFIRYQNNGVSLPFTPFALATIDLEAENELDILSNSVNIDVNKSSWSDKTVVLYFNHPHSDKNYRVFAQTSNQISNLADLQQLTPILKTEDHFTIGKPIGTLDLGQRIFVRVF